MPFSPMVRRRPGHAKRVPSAAAVWLDGGELDKILAAMRVEVAKPRVGENEHPHFGKRKSVGLLAFF
jgi:Zn-finger nucleic acid-binding protein